MPFNALPFLLLFLPASLALDALRDAAPSGVRRAWRAPLLLALSAVFYGWWDPRFLPLLATSILLNWGLAEAYRRAADRGAPRIALLVLAGVLDLALLALFKYLDFLSGLLDLLPGVDLPPVGLALPLGISFFTFQHLAYLVDLRRGTAPRLSLLDYALYVAFFPRVIAGPLVRPAAFAADLAAGGRDRAGNLAGGLVLLALGLTKKVVLGDGLAADVDPLWSAVAAGAEPGFPAAAAAALGYTLQLYFDFSGYTDMARGIACMLGVDLPENFEAPYRATSIQDFWRRWHVTLSFFLRDYLYIPFGGSRHGLPRQLGALFATMALGGLWHGAGLTFVAWGAAHGIALGAHVLWRRAGLALPSALGLVATIGFVALAWVLFRAPDFASATRVYAGLAGWGANDAARAVAGPDAAFWGLAALAGALALVGPTARDLAARLPLNPATALATAALLAGLLLQVGNDANRAFLYARF